MPLIIEDFQSLQRFDKQKFDNINCIFDYDEKKGFYFREGKDCEDTYPYDKIGSKITKRAVREMRRKYDKKHHEDCDLICIDYGKDILEFILKNCAGIRFYFGLKEKNGESVLSLILVGINEDGKDVVNLEEKSEADVVGAEVGTGTRVKEYKSNKDLQKKMKVKEIRINPK